MFDYIRQLLTRKSVQAFLKKMFEKELEVDPELQERYGYDEKVKSFSESQFLLLLQHNPDFWTELDEYLEQVRPDDPKQEELRKKWAERFAEFLSDPSILNRFRRYNDPTEPVSLRTEDGSPGFVVVDVVANTEKVYEDGTRKPAEDIKSRLIEEIKKTKHSIRINIYDIDSMDIAEALVKLAAEGKEVIIGVDKDVPAERPGEVEVAKYLKKESAKYPKIKFNKLNREEVPGLHFGLVDGVGLDHQKLVVIDAELPGEGLVILMTSNGTQSCMGKEGDAVDIPIEQRPKESIPNANHMIVIRSDILAQIVKHELEKVLVMGLRGKEFPLRGAFRLYGEGASKAQNPDVDPFMMITFSPHHGEKGDIGKYMIERMIDTYCAENFWAMEYAFSSVPIGNAIQRCVEKLKKEGKWMDFKGVFDGSFAKRNFSVPLAMSGLGLMGSGDEREFVRIKDSPWRKTFAKKEEFEKFKNGIRIGPWIYATRIIKLADGTEREITAKIHHKAMGVGVAWVAGSSYNPSEAAGSNNEQIAIFVRVEKINREMTAIARGLYLQSKMTVEQEVLRWSEVDKLEDLREVKACDLELKKESDRAKSKDEGKE
jgi:hypothetical protein